MGIYLEEHFIKDKDGSWVPIRTQIVKAPHDLGRWQRSVELDSKNNNSDFSVFQTRTTKSGFNKKVTNIVSMFGRNERVDRTLLTTSNKLSRIDKEKYKNVKGVNKPITR